MSATDIGRRGCKFARGPSFIYFLVILLSYLILSLRLGILLSSLGVLVYRILTVQNFKNVSERSASARFCCICLPDVLVIFMKETD